MGLVTSAIGFGGFVGQWGQPAASDYIGRRMAGIIGFVAGAVWTCNGLVPVTCLSLCHLSFESQGAYAAQI
jgi:hypothetical protein